MRSDQAHHYLNRILTTVLQPRCALCDENHGLPDRLCPACKISIASAERERFEDSLRASAAIPRQRQAVSSVVRSSRAGAERQGQGQNLAILDTVISAFNYQSAVPELITRWKYQGMIELTDYMAALVTELIAKGKLSMPDYNLVTVIPSHWRRRLTRGFDPVWLLANALARKGVIDKPVSTLKQSRGMPYQHLKRLNARRIDPDQFRATERVFGKKVLIIDDVITSGATLNAAAVALKTAGAQSISGFTFATANTKSIARDEIAEK